ncbi:hypothetical protein RCL1_005016 [Eukaryota sp. TZLM3-RCL]
MNLFLLLLLLTLSFANHLLFSRPVNFDVASFDSTRNNPIHIVSLNSNRFLIVSKLLTTETYFFTVLSIDYDISITSTTLLSPLSCALDQDKFILDTSAFPGFSLSFVHLSTEFFHFSTQDVILIAFEFSSSNLNNQFNQLSLKVFSLLNLQESNTFEFIIENDLMSLYFNEFSLEQDQSIIANITITHNSNQCTTEFPHEVQFNSIVSCSFCISNTGYTNTSSSQIIDKSIELQTNVTSYCSFLKESVPLFLIVSDYKLLVTDNLHQQTLLLTSPLSKTRIIDHVYSTDDMSLFLVFSCKSDHCQIRTMKIFFSLSDLIPTVTVVSLSAGAEHSSALLSDGRIKTWGYGLDGRLGHGDEDNRLSPVTVDGIVDAIAISCGHYHSLVLIKTGHVVAFGSNSNGQIGGSVFPHFLKPTPITQLSDIISVSTGSFHSIALKKDGTVWTWGSNTYRQLGRPSSNTDRPVMIQAFSNLVAISAGAHHNLALRASGGVASWGRGAHGRLGNNIHTDQQYIQACGSFNNAVFISAGNAQSFILTSTGQLSACGLNDVYQLGLGDTQNRLVPVALSSDLKFATVSAGSSCSMGILVTGEVVVWVNNSGQLTGPSGTIPSPFILTDLLGIYNVSLGK